MIKLKYKTINFNGLTINYARYRKNRNLRLSISGSGEIKLTCPYFVSEEEILSFIESRETWIRKCIKAKDDTIILSSYPPLNKKQKQELLLKLSSYIEKYEILMNTKVYEFGVRKMRTLWGSCSYGEAKIRFNSYLYFMSDYFIEYIVVHEMAHLFVHNHSDRFYQIVKKYLPDYKKRWAEHKKVTLR